MYQNMVEQRQHNSLYYTLRFKRKYVVQDVHICEDLPDTELGNTVLQPFLMDSRLKYQSS